MLDVEEYPALDLACCYPRRPGCETVTGHHKTGIGQGQPYIMLAESVPGLQTPRASDDMCGPQLGYLHGR